MTHASGGHYIRAPGLAMLQRIMGVVLAAVAVQLIVDRRPGYGE